MMRHKSKSTDTNSGVVVGGGGNAHRVWRLVWLGVVVFVLAGGAGIGASILLHRSPKPQSSPAATVQQAQNLALDGNYAKATQQLQRELKDSKLTKSQKYALLFQQGITYENQKKYSEALAAYTQADGLKPTEATAAAVARTAAEMGNKTLAIAYYKKAIARISTTSPIRSDTKQEYELRIKNLGGQ